MLQHTKYRLFAAFNNSLLVFEIPLLFSPNILTDMLSYTLELHYLSRSFSSGEAQTNKMSLAWERDFHLLVGAWINRWIAHQLPPVLQKREVSAAFITIQHCSSCCQKSIFPLFFPCIKIWVVASLCAYDDIQFNI